MIDDNDDIRHSLGLLLRHWGYDVTGARDLSHLFEQYDFQELLTQTVVISDMNLGYKNGTDFLMELHDHDYHRTLLISGYPIREYQGIRLKKPFSGDELKEKVDQAITINSTSCEFCLAR